MIDMPEAVELRTQHPGAAARACTATLTPIPLAPSLPSVSSARPPASAQSPLWSRWAPAPRCSTSSGLTPSAALSLRRCQAAVQGTPRTDQSLCTLTLRPTPPRVAVAQRSWCGCASATCRSFMRYATACSQGTLRPASPSPSPESLVANALCWRAPLSSHPTA